MNFIQKSAQFCREEIKKLKEMSGKDRMWYISEYYKIHIICILVVLIFTFSIISNMVKVSNIEFEALVINTISADPSLKPLTLDFPKYMDFQKKESVSLNTVSFDPDGTSQDTAIAINKIYALVVSESVDIAIMNQPVFDLLNSSSPIFMDLEANLPDYLVKKIAPSIVYATDIDTGKQVAVGIDITGTDFYQNCGFEAEPTILCIPYNAPHFENCIAFLQYIGFD